MEKGREARRFMDSLQPIVVSERAKRGVVKPTEGECSECGSNTVHYWDDGWGECKACGHRIPWSTRQEPRFISFLKRKLTK